MKRDLAERLRTALTAGLHVEGGRETYGCSIEAVMAHVAASQLRAIRCAMLMGDPDDGIQEDGRGWCATGRFTRLDAVAAIGGVMALLQESHAIATDIRTALGEPTCDDQAAPPLGRASVGN